MNCNYSWVNSINNNKTVGSWVKIKERSWHCENCSIKHFKCCKNFTIRICHILNCKGPRTCKKVIISFLHWIWCQFFISTMMQNSNIYLRLNETRWIQLVVHNSIQLFDFLSHICHCFRCPYLYSRVCQFTKARCVHTCCNSLI
jgi:hypothetical protein